jgi:hypothetical protein
VRHISLRCSPREFWDRIPVGARFSAPVQNGLGAYPAFCTMGTESVPWVKRPGRGVDHPPPSSTKVKERVELYLYSPSGPSWPVLGWTLPYPGNFVLYFLKANIYKYSVITDIIFIHQTN